MSEIIRELPIWFFIYGYAVAFSIAVDALLMKLRRGPAKLALTVLLYVLGGFAPLLLMFHQNWMLGLFAGLYGVPCALVFLYASRLLLHRWPYNLAAAILLLAGAIYMSTADFTKTSGWTETRAENSYRAEFDYFHGYRQIPVQLESGQTLAYHVEWQASGGYGTRLNTKSVKGAYVNVEHGGERWVAYKTEEAATIYIVVTGNRAKGALTIRWEISR